MYPEGPISNAAALVVSTSGPPEAVSTLMAEGWEGASLTRCFGWTRLQASARTMLIAIVVRDVTRRRGDLTGHPSDCLASTGGSGCTSAPHFYDTASPALRPEAHV